MKNARRVKLDGRTFFVKFDEAGQPRTIVERKLYAPGAPWESICDVTRWSLKSNGMPTRGLYARILAMSGEC